MTRFLWSHGPDGYDIAAELSEGPFRVEISRAVSRGECVFEIAIERDGEERFRGFHGSLREAKRFAEDAILRAEHIEMDEEIARRKKEGAWPDGPEETTP